MLLDVRVSVADIEERLCHAEMPQSCIVVPYARCYNACDFHEQPLTDGRDMRPTEFHKITGARRMTTAGCPLSWTVGGGMAAEDRSWKLACLAADAASVTRSARARYGHNSGEEQRCARARKAVVSRRKLDGFRLATGAAAGGEAAKV